MKVLLTTIRFVMRINKIIFELNIKTLSSNIFKPANTVVLHSCCTCLLVVNMSLMGSIQARGEEVTTLEETTMGMGSVRILSSSAEGCCVQGKCTMPREGAQLQFNIGNEEENIPLNPVEAPPAIQTDQYKISFRKDFVNTGFLSHLDYSFIYTPNITYCRDDIDLLNIKISCKATVGMEEFDEDSIQPSMISNIRCDKMNNSYSIRWNKEGCDNNVALVTLSDSKGNSLQQTVTETSATLTVNSDSEYTFVHVQPEMNYRSENPVDHYSTCQTQAVSTTDSPGATSIYNAWIMAGSADFEDPAPLLKPGQSYFQAFNTSDNDSYLSIVVKRVLANDQFLAFSDEGLPLFNNAGTPLFENKTDVSQYLLLWDAGTEINQRPGLGKGQILNGNYRLGVDPEKNVREYQHDYFGSSVNASELALVTLEYIGFEQGSYQFNVELENRGANYTVNPLCHDTQSEMLSSAVGVVHGPGAPLFKAGHPDYGQGLEQLAEDGDVIPLSQSLNITEATSASDSSKDNTVSIALGITIPVLLVSAVAGAISATLCSLRYRKGKMVGTGTPPSDITAVTVGTSIVMSMEVLKEESQRRKSPSPTPSIKSEASVAAVTGGIMQYLPPFSSLSSWLSRSRQ